MALTLDEQIANVEAAILRAEEAEEYGLGGRRKRSAPLAVLYARLDKLTSLKNRQTHGIVSVITIDRPT